MAEYKTSSGNLLHLWKSQKCIFESHK